MAVLFDFFLLQMFEDRRCGHAYASGKSVNSIVRPRTNRRTDGRAALRCPMRCLKHWAFLAGTFVLPLLALGAAQAGSWKKTSVPQYAKSVHALALGDDGRIYSVSSNRHGYFFQSVLPTYRLEAGAGKDDAGQLLARRNMVFLAESCDAYTPDTTGIWSRDGLSKTYRMTIAGGKVITFRLLSGDPEPRHACSFEG